MSNANLSTHAREVARWYLDNLGEYPLFKGEPNEITREKCYAKANHFRQLAYLIEQGKERPCHRGQVARSYNLNFLGWPEERRRKRFLFLNPEEAQKTEQAA